MQQTRASILTESTKDCTKPQRLGLSKFRFLSLAMMEQRQWQKSRSFLQRYKNAWSNNMSCTKPRTRLPPWKSGSSKRHLMRCMIYISSFWSRGLQVQMRSKHQDPSHPLSDQEATLRSWIHLSVFCRDKLALKISTPSL